MLRPPDPLMRRGRLAKGSPAIAKSEKHTRIYIIPQDAQVLLIALSPLLMCIVASVALGVLR
jgi:hypothetical protein